MNDIVQIIRKTEKDYKNFGMRKVLVNNKFLFCEFRESIEIHDIEKSIAVVVVKHKSQQRPQQIFYKCEDPKEIQHLHLEDKITTVLVDVSDIKIQCISIDMSVSFVEDHFSIVF